MGSDYYEDICICIDYISKEAIKKITNNQIINTKIMHLLGICKLSQRYYYIIDRSRIYDNNSHEDIVYSEKLIYQNGGYITDPVTVISNDGYVTYLEDVKVIVDHYKSTCILIKASLLHRQIRR